MRHLPVPGLLALLVCLAPAAAAQELDDAEPVGWPRELGTDRFTVVLFQPEVEESDGVLLTGRAAVSVAEAGGSPVFGVVWFEARLETDRDTRMADVVDVAVPHVRFPDATEEHQQQLADYLATEVGRWDLSLSLDRLLTGLDLDEDGLSAPNLNVEAPPVLYRGRPTVMVQIDGDPILQDVEGTSYRAVINTAFTILQDGNDFYLYASADTWYRGPSATGPFEPADRVPSGISALIPDDADQDQPSEEDGVVRTGPPEVVVVTEPTELLATDGDPTFVPIADTDLLVVDNTTSDILMEIGSQQYYVLLAGRWYRGPSLEGPWTWVSGQDLPETFQEIPSDSDMGSVRAHVAGTEEAQEAVMDAQLPQTETIQRSAPSPEVQYDGSPEFEPVEETQLEYAVNTPQQIIKLGDTYYLCEEAVWYVSDSAEGPWRVTDYVPEEIYDIPATNPNHNVTYVHVYDSTPEVVYVGYTPGYTGTYVYGGTVVYGTGWWYHPWYRRYYFARPFTWGFSVRWNPWTGWSMGLTWSNGWFTFGIGTGWGRPWCCYGGWWGPAGFRRGYYAGRRAGFRAGYRAGYRAGQRAAYRNNIYRRQNNAARNAARPARQDRVQPRRADVPNNVHADRNGNVHRRNDDGTWQRRDGDRWGRSTNQPSVGQGSTRPSTGDRSRPSTGTRPSTGDRSRPAAPSQPSAGGRPSTGDRAAPSTGNRGAPSTGGRTSPSTNPSWRSGSISGNQGRSGQDLNRSARSRSRGNARSGDFQRSRGGGAARGGRRR